MNKHMDMLMRALAEGIKKERLDEKEAIKSDLTQAGGIKVGDRTYKIANSNDKKNFYKDHPDFKGSKSNVAISTVVDSIKNVANNADNINKLRDGDFIKAGFIGTTEELGYVDELKKYLNARAQEAADILVQLGKDTKMSLDNIDPAVRNSNKTKL